MAQQGVVSDAQRPVGPSKAAAPLIVVGLDGSPTSWDAFAWAAGEAARCGGSLVAVYVAPVVEPVAAFGDGYGYEAVEQAREELIRDLKKEAESRAGNAGVGLQFVAERGDTAPALAQVAHAMAADLIVVGKSAKMLHHLAGSLGRRLVSRPDSPVIVVVP